MGSFTVSFALSGGQQLTTSAVTTLAWLRDVYRYVYPRAEDTVPPPVFGWSEGKIGFWFFRPNSRAAVLHWQPNLLNPRIRNLQLTVVDGPPAASSESRT